MSNEIDSAATRLWRDKAQIREQERDHAVAQLRIAKEKVAILTDENDRLTAEVARLRAERDPLPEKQRSETELQMEALRGALLPLIETTGRKLN